MLDSSKVQGELEGFRNNTEFVEYARELWSGKVAKGNMVDSRSVKWLEVMERGNFDLTRGGVIEGLYKLSRVYREGEQVDTTKEEVKNIAMKEAVTFMSKIQDLKAVDGSIRIAMSKEMYYGNKVITDKGLGDAIDMSEFVQIIRTERSIQGLYYKWLK
jgi:hypothetical protein